MKLIIAGSRTFGKYLHDTILLELTLQKINADAPVSEVVSGCAKGADAGGESWANRLRIPIKKFPAKWSNLGKRAGHARNAEMADYADRAVVFWDGKSKGSKNMIEQMKKRNKPVEVVYIHVMPAGATDDSLERIDTETPSVGL